MSSKQLHTVLIAILVLLFAALLGGTYGVNKLLVSQSNKLVLLKAKDQALDQEQVSLNKAKSDIARYDDLNKIAQAVVPQDKNQAEAVREIVNIAASNHIFLASINFPASTLGTSSTGAVTTTPTLASSAAANAANNKTAKFSQLTKLSNIPGVYQLPITLGNDSNHPASYTDFINFLSDLEHNRRTSQVQQINIQPAAATKSSVIFSLTLNEYIKP